MKYILVIFFATSFAEDKTREEFTAKLRLAFSDCIESTKMDLASLIEPEDANLEEPAPDFYFCLYKKMGYMDEAGEYQVDEMKSQLAYEFGKDEASRIVDECTKDRKDDGSQTAQHMAKCFSKYQKTT